MEDLPDRSHEASGSQDKRAEKASAKEQKRADKAAARADREAELAKRDDETLGVLSGFRVFEDGTVQKESSSSALTSSAVAAWQSKLGQSGLLPEMKPRSRSAVVGVTLSDKRVRKPFARTRAALPSTGLFTSGRDYFGSVSLTIATRDWTEHVEASSEEQVAALEALNSMLLQAQSVAASERQVVLEQSEPPPPPGIPSDVPRALRELKELHDEGILTDDEYETRRQALISHL
jgi:hypothetical protein